jgi:hypothetical protein
MKNKKYYHTNRKRTIVDKTHIEEYLANVRQKIQNGAYRFAINKKRPDNVKLFSYYVIDERKAKEIILTLNHEDFSDILQNEHKGYEHEFLYVFGKTVVLNKIDSQKPIPVPLYIKINNISEYSVIIISFHEQKYQLKYYFKRYNNE